MKSFHFPKGELQVSLFVNIFVNSSPVSLIPRVYGDWHPRLTKESRSRDVSR